MRLIVVLTVSLALAGCSEVVDGTAAPAEAPATTTATPTTTAPAMVTTASLSTLLLKRGELGTIVGDTDMNQLQEITTAVPNIMANPVEPRDCRDRTLVAESGMGFRSVQGVLGNVNRGAGGQAPTQVVAVFGNREDPGRAFEVARLDWDRCPQGQLFTIDVGNGDTDQWEAGEMVTGQTRIGNTITRLDPAGRTCHKVIAIQANVMVETSVCGTGDVTGQANEIADVILAKVPD